LKITNLKISLAAAAVSVGLCCFYFLSRWGLPNTFSDFVKIIGVSWFIIFFPDLLLRAIKLVRTNADNFFYDECLASLGALCLVACSGLIIMNFHWQYIFVGMGYLFFIISFTSLIKHIAKKDVIPIFAVLLFTIMVASVAWEGRHLSPLFIEMLSNGEFSSDFGNGLDTLFHLSIAQMIKTYGIASIGLDQLVPIRYHFGSHYLLAQVSKALNLHLLTTYQLAYPVIFYSLFFKIFLYTTFKLRTFLKIDRTHTGPFFWLTLLLGFFGLIPVSYRHFLLTRMGLGLDTIWVSESYLLSLILFFSILSIMLTAHQQLTTNNSFAENNRTKKHFLYIIVILLLTVAAGLSKISTMAILLSVCGYLFVRLQLFKRIGILFLFITLLILAFFVHSITAPSMGTSTGYEFLYSYTKFISTNFTQFIILYYFLFLFVLAFYFLRYRLHKKHHLSQAIKDKSLLHLEVLTVIALAGFLPGAFIKIEGGSAFYFIEIQYWCALLIILASLPLLTVFISGFLNKVRYKAILKTTCLTLMVAVVLYNACIRLSIYMYNNIHTRKQILTYEKGIVPKADQHVFMKRLKKAKWQTVKESLVTFSKPINEKLNQIPIHGVYASMMALDTLPNKHTALVFIKDYVKLMDQFPCYKYSFVVPALTGMATLEGYDDEACSWFKNYGFEDYPKRERSFYKASTDDLCKKVSGTEFQSIYVFNLDRATYDVISCPGTY
jgi:hypothetical protein